MGNKMEEMKQIDGHLQTQSSQPLRDFPPQSHLKVRKHREGGTVSVTPPTTRSPKIQALTLKQLSAGLSVTTEKTESERRSEGVTRDYTVFDMADAVTVTHPPLQEERLENHQPGEESAGQRPHFQTYSETAPLRISTQEAGGKFVVIIV